MENTISLAATSEGTEKKVTFKFKKVISAISVDVFLEEEKVGDMQINVSDFNDFCLDLFNAHKKIMAEEKYVIRDVEIANPKTEIREGKSYLIGGDIVFKNGMIIGKVDKENNISFGITGKTGIVG
jgi:hypothetical protein